MVFPGCGQAASKNRGGLPATGMMLRHTYRSEAADLKIDELLSHFLMGHAPGMRDAQRKISRRIMSLLGVKELE